MTSKIEKKILEKHRKCERTRSVCESDTGRKLNLPGGRREDNEPQVRMNKTQVEHNQTEDTPCKQTTNGSQHSQLDRTHQSFKAILQFHPLCVFMHQSHNDVEDYQAGFKYFCLFVTTSIWGNVKFTI